MTRELALMIMIGVAVVLLALLAWGWVRRSRRDRDYAIPVGEIPAGARVRDEIPVMYIATTAHGEPLERLALPGLGYRSRADVTVTDRGLALDLTGQPRLFLPTARVREVSQATVVIDRVVERDGLVRVTWLLDRPGHDPVPVDTYLRGEEISARALADALRSAAAPTPTPTGGDA